MKHKHYFLILLIPIFCNLICKKHDHTHPSQPEHNCDDCQNLISIIGGDGSYVFVPNAFTPNGDGKNDALGVVHNGIKPGSFSLRVHSQNHTTVKTLTDPAQRWDGKDENGNLLAVGDYPADIIFETTEGKRIETCTCISLLQANGNGCIERNGKTYYFEDQVDVKTGFVYTTGENICK